MGFPDRIERTVDLSHPPARVWTALTTAEGLAAWFAESAGIELEPGGAAWLEFGGGMAQRMRIERVEEPSVFGFTWQVYGLPDDDPRRTYVEFTLEPSVAGTRLTVVETGFAQLPAGEHAKAFGGNVDGWKEQFDNIAKYLDAA
ncbi:SRPBCC domain-containing protein [Actinomadura oligospora]|uniref:SRPBCC domain-containing protein n=1 Tax=Actinomadura oligospora TaxID=111804 RepID=UPI00047A6FAA|nr:SRPBCC domain-containing protein [Actinomadura oligospora]